MKHKILITLIAVFFSAGLFAQDCEAYIPTKLGVKQTYKTMNKKGKVQSYYSQELISKTSEDGGTKFEILQMDYDDKKELQNQDTLTFLCKDNMFIIDMSGYLSEEQMGQYDEAQIEVSSDNISYPANMKPGTTLKDGYVQADIDMGMVLTFKTDITNRRVESYETITTEAGTFKTVKVSEDISSKIGFVTVKMKSINWVKANVGNIKTESYNKKGSLMMTTELISIE